MVARRSTRTLAPSSRAKRSMKSPEVYALLRQELGPLLKSLGFKREKSFLSWSRKHDDQYTVVWCQVSRDGWDEYAGSQFTVEFQRSKDPEVGAPSTQRKRISALLSDAQREDVRRIQNTVLSSLRHAPSNHPALHVSPEVSKWYLAKFDLIADPYASGHDIWLRYAASEHVKAWAVLLATVIPQCVQSVEGGG